ncbi:similar to Saccharomyces cerevisiae YKR020W VPS51 Component of the GARP (Golgi-associated retrograde protein) complex [Maudiozyma saulgeensis]|uniref:Similar to Saccharomyces cerevisiae YKR020W VPS51 Component of the GARP (Golgi-associated retrograde protein) complex n=1 Tax=Maudiozyma saulgeensis TaxID=1789683 RepID=A0A1X7R1H0_9SACH|nr:similar to Saccharomyces cerevisiae YKR020W VPS51 Component of the GARP (Golgi-associated retrograde protein) complex [Kazachstania saulgeensis]
MAEQISHNRSLGVKKLNEDKKRLLKEYYKLSDEIDTNADNDGVASSSTEGDIATTSSTEIPDNNENDVTSIESSNTDPERQINEMTLQQILQIHNRLVGQEIEMSNSIKNTIYDNYYDLVKVNTLLQDIVQRDSSTTTDQQNNNTNPTKENRIAALLGQLRTLSEP